jgi:hypothetical protein
METVLCGVVANPAMALKNGCSVFGSNGRSTIPPWISVALTEWSTPEAS